MATYTVTTTPSEDEGLSYAAGRFNTERSSISGFEPYSPAAYFDKTVHDVLAGFAEDKKLDAVVGLKVDFIEALTHLTEEQRVAIDAVLKAG